MQYRNLGKSGIKVSEICLGTMTFGGRSFFKACGELGERESRELVSAAFGEGVNFFDTADYYSEGLAEELLGKALGKRRKDAIVATKVYFPMGSGKDDRGLSRAHIMKAIDASLGRLGTDYVDLYQVHNFDGQVPLEETLETLNALVVSGRVRQIGCSNFTGWQIMKALSLSEKHGWAKFVSTQSLYTLVMRDAEFEIVPLSRDQDLGLLCWSPLAAGFLTGKYRRDKPRPKGARRENKEEQFLQFDEERGFDIVDTLERIAERRAITIPEVALNYLLRKPAVTSVIVGARTIAQFEKTVRSSDWSLGSDEMAELDQISRPELPYPYWFQEKTAVDR